MRRNTDHTDVYEGCVFGVIAVALIMAIILFGVFIWAIIEIVSSIAQGS